MFKRVGATCALAVLLNIAAVSLRAEAPLCGVANKAVAETVSRAREQSLFVFAYEPQSGNGNFKDRNNVSLVFVGNAFLIDVQDTVEGSIGFFATAKHNLATACIEAKKLGVGLPKVRLVAANGASLVPTGPSQQQCVRLIELAEKAGTTDVVFNPDLSVMSGLLPPGPAWRPILIGSVEATPTGDGVVEHMDQQLTAKRSQSVNLPTPTFRPEQARHNWLRVIADKNEPGTSGSAFVSTLGASGKPVALGVVTHSFPASVSTTEEDNESSVVDESILSRQELRNLIAATLGDLSGKAYSLISTLEVLAKEYDPAPPSGIAQIYEASERLGFTNMDSAVDKIGTRLAGSGASAIVYLWRECQSLDPSKLSILKLTFCHRVIAESVESQCLYSQRQWSLYIAARFPGGSGITYQDPGNAVKAANEARQMLSTGTPETAKGVVPVLQAALAQPLQGKLLVRPAWDSAAVFDLAKAERAAGGDIGDYLNRLRQSIEINPANLLAKRAFVDAVAQSGREGDAKEAAKYLGQLTATRKISEPVADETLAALRGLDKSLGATDKRALDKGSEVRGAADGQSRSTSPRR